VIAALALVALAQGPPDVTAAVDRTRVRVGEPVTLTVRARARSVEPLDIVLPSLAGFAIVGSRDFTEVSVGGSGGSVRTTSRSLELRADRAGTLVIGPVTVRQGARTVRTDPISVTVDSAAGTGNGLAALARSLLETAAPPTRADEVSLTIVLSADTVIVGQQLDVVAAAWFPREIRNRLRQAPVVTLAAPNGVWAYPPIAPEGVALSRKVRGQWMDLFVVHQVEFPLAPGRLALPPAAVAYGLPVTFSFFSREERYELQSDSIFLVAVPSPAAGRPADDRGVVGRGLTLALTVEPTDTRVGEPIEVSADVTGVGNVALWADPALRWPAGFRVYPGQTTTRVQPLGGLIAGTKTFHYLAVPDSAGSFLLPEVRYLYYDLGTGTYAVVHVAPRTLAVAPGAEPRAARALPSLLARGPEAGGVSGALGDLPAWTWLLAWLLPALLWLLGRRPRAAVAAVATPAQQLSRLGRLEREFQGVLANHVVDPETRAGDGLARALRAAGIEPAVAEHVMRLRDRLRSARYGPRGVGDPAELGAELEQVLRVLRGGGRRGGRLALAGIGALLVLAAPAHAQRSSAEALYEAGALRAAADSFAARAAAEPRIAAHWYDLGATLYRAGADGKATTAWTIAARLAPRNAVVRRARRLLPPPDAASESLLAVGPATPAEWWLAATFAWWLAWALVLARRRARWPAALAVLACLAGGLGTVEWRHRQRPVAVVLAPATPVRVAPYGSATAGTSLDVGAAVLVEDHYGAWLRVARPDGVRGWVLARDVATL